MDNVALSGYMFCWVRGIANQLWQKRFYVLYGATSNSQGRLDYYENAESHRRDPKVRKTIYVEEIKSIEKTTTPGHPHSFELHIAREDQTQVHVFATESESDLSDWLRCINQVRKDDKVMKMATSTFPTTSVPDNGAIMFDQNDIYESADDFSMYHVKVQETEAAKRCHLSFTVVYDLCVLSEHIVLIESDRRILSWAYKHIRRYGCGENTFTFEAGRKSKSGEGLFSFTVPNGEQLFKIVQDQMKGLQKKRKSDHTDECRSRDEPPSLPARNYALGSAGAAGEEAQFPSPPNLGSDDAPVIMSRYVDSQVTETKSKVPQVMPKPKGMGKLPFPFANKAKSKERKKSDPMDVTPSPPSLDKEFQAELTNKLATKQPPMLKPRGQPNNPPVSPSAGTRHLPWSHPPSSGSNNRVSTGECYELAKAKLPWDQAQPDSCNYMDTARSMDVDAKYVRCNPTHVSSPSTSPTETAPTNHDYAIYDITQSSQFRKRLPSPSGPGEDADLYSEATLPKTKEAWKEFGMEKITHKDNYLEHRIYDEPAVPEAASGAVKMADIIDKIHSTRVTPSNGQYDHINIKKSAGFRDLNSGADGNLYGQLQNSHRST